MSEEKNEELKEYADGWITERKGTDAPMFLKAAYIVITLGTLSYLFMYMNGEVDNETRGPLVQAFNKVTGTADGFMYFVIALVVIYAIILLSFVWGKSKH
ncbi:MAG TPA: hypothetical protein PKY82_20700 [Pyrinomonadaceae bacterium]|jgi:hypothetical protein|nr:hypothetical protein [Pyrinomonadaceae bacterium]